jgi:16S rRNA (cytidine1402-2'-O)-methyltransferase
VIILVGTPLGNLSDASPRARETLASAQVLAVEDTRVARKLLDGLGLTEAHPRFMVMHDHNERNRTGELLEIARDEDVVVVTDAGMPTVSDPGYRLVAAAAQAGVRVTAVPGPTAVTTALAVSGLPTDQFAFEGFPPRKPGDLRTALRGLAGDPRTLVFYESPKRVAATLAACAEVFGPDRRAVVARELTKLHEEILRGSLAELAEWAATGQPRGEIVLVVAGAPETGAPLAPAVAETRELVALGVRTKDACRHVAAHRGVRANALYSALLDTGGDGA